MLRPISGGFNELTGLQQTRVPTTSIKKKSGAEKPGFQLFTIALLK